MEEIKCPYTKEMIASENQFLNHLEEFAKPPEQLNLKIKKENLVPINTLVPLTLGKNKGEPVPVELKTRLEKEIAKEIKQMKPTKADYETDVIVVRNRRSRFMCSH